MISLKQYQLQTNLLKHKYFYTIHQGQKQERLSYFIFHQGQKQERLSYFILNRDQFWKFTCEVRVNNIRAQIPNPWNCSSFSVANNKGIWTFCELVSVSMQRSLVNNFLSYRSVPSIKKDQLDLLTMLRMTT